MFLVTFSTVLCAVLAAATLPPVPLSRAADAVPVASSLQQPWAVFTASNETLLLTTPVFRLGLGAATGRLDYLVDAAAEVTLFYGSASGQLWNLQGPNGALSNNDPALNFTFAWADPTLTLSYVHPDGARIAVTVSAPAQQRFFDMAFALEAPPRALSTAPFDSLWFPSQPLFNGSVTDLFYPQLPGIILNTSWFAQGVTTSVPYPGSGSFMDLVHLNVSGASTVSLFSVAPPSLAVPAFHGFSPAPKSGAGLVAYSRSFSPINVSNGCDAANGGWLGGSSRPAWTAAAPPCALGAGGAVRVRVALAGTILEDTALYGAANALRLPGIAAKLPAPLLQQLGRAPLYKVDAIGLGLPFSAYAREFYPLLPQPGLVHFVACENISFDRFYPDWLPPAARWGSTCDALDAWRAAQASGHLAMPYTNPTWWDPVAPTLSTELAAASLSLADVCTLNATLQPQWETYPDTPPCSGVVTELRHPYVFARWQRVLCQLQGGAAWACPAPASCNDTALPSDLLFEDQLGARNARADRSPAQAGLGALGAQDDIAQHAANFSAARLGTEQGYDRLAEHVYGFFGAAGAGARMDAGAGWPWFSGNFTPFPAAPALFGGSVLYHVHNLATAAFANSVPLACWALATGARLSVDGTALYWAAQGGRADDVAMAAAAAAMQAVVASQWTGYALAAFDDLAAGGGAQRVGRGASRTVLQAAPAAPAIYATASPAYNVVANWEAARELPADAAGARASAVLPPGGCLAYGSAGDVVGGFVVEYNGRRLPAGLAHAVIEDRACAQGVCVRHPMGADTPLDVAAPASCAPGAQPACSAYSTSGAAMGGVPCSLAGGLVTFNATARLGGKPVAFFALSCTP